MKRLHQAVGVTGLIIFVLTGQYLRRRYPHIDEMADGMRMLLRSRHLYIMLAGALNLGIGLYFTARPPGWRKLVQVTGSVLILIAPALLITAFFTEPQLGILQTPWSHYGLYAIFGGVILHLISSAGQSREAAPPLKA
jgi:hypothetical protein